MGIRFGITFLPDEPRPFIEWCRMAEAVGFDIVAIPDSQSLYRECYVSCTLCAMNTSRVRFGPRVINPLTRHPAVAASAQLTLEELAPGRTFLGIGTGDSAVLNLGLRSSSIAQLEEYALAVRSLLTTGTSTFQGREARLTWGRAKVPLYLAASGPKVLRLAGRIADGVVVNAGLLPEIVRDSIAQVHIGAEQAGRDLSEIDIWFAPLANIAPSRQQAVDEIKMSLASTGSHLPRYSTEGKHIPPELVGKLRELLAHYHADQHDMPQSANRQLVEELGLVDYLADRFAIAGTPDDCVRQLERAIEAGARQFWCAIHFDHKVRFMEEWSTRVMPAFR